MTASAPEPVEVVRSIYEAFAAGDRDRIAAHLDAEVELTDPDLPGGGTFHGIDGVFEFLRLWTEAFSEHHVDVEELIPVDGGVVAVVHQRGVATASGAAVDMRAAHLWTDERGLVTRIELFQSREAALAAAGA
jgi:ketosteroid isomerase-like protein